MKRGADQLQPEACSVKRWVCSVGGLKRGADHSACKDEGVRSAADCDETRDVGAVGDDQR